MSELDITGVAGLLGVSRPRVWQLRKKPDFPAARLDSKQREYWYDHEILRWAASDGRLADKAPVLFRPVPAGPAAEYFGVEAVRGGTVLKWDTAVGLVAMHFPRPSAGAGDRYLWPTPASLDVDALVVVLSTEDPWGPELEAVDAAFPDRTYEPRWTDLARIFGTTAPWWQSRLRRLPDMQMWKPGARPQAIHPVPETDTSALLQMAATEPDGSPVNATLMYLAREIQSRTDHWVARDMEDVAGWADRDAIAVAGVPTEPTAEPEQPSEVVRREAWLKILASTSRLATDCVGVALQNDGGRDFPFSTLAVFQADDRGKLLAEFAARLRPTERTAGFALFADDMIGQTLIDPQTDLPVARSEGGTLRAAVPQRLPALAPLAEVTLDHGGQLWIRTEDGKLWLAPEQSGTGYAWGYGGSGPRALAVLLELLLDDINAPAPDGLRGREPSPGLLEGTRSRWPSGTTLTRADLEAARLQP